MDTIVFLLQFITAVTLIVLMAVQTDKAEQGGVMGIGAAGGRSTSNVDMAVGAERILKPLTIWVGVGFLFTSILSAVDKVTIWHLLGAIVVYVLVMAFGNRIWMSVTGARR